MRLVDLAALGAGPVVLHSGHVPRAAVTRSRELSRILAIPRRAPAANGTLTLELRAPGGTMALWPEQARALDEARAARGLFAPISVGGGKTLLAALLPVVLGVECAVVLTSAGLVAQAERMLEEYARHFVLSPGLRWVSYGILSSANQCHLLEELQPELIIADEAQNLASHDSARSRRFLRYMRAHPETLFCALSGTITKRSIRDYAHLLELALGDRTPLPRDWPTLTEWAEALDVSDNPRPPGALLELDETQARNNHTSSFAGADLERARAGVRRRLLDTRGVVASGEGSLDVPLRIRVVPGPNSPRIDLALRALARTWTRPDGEELTYAVELARVSRQLRLGGYYRWLWPDEVPDLEWLDARRLYRAALRDFLARRSRPGLDSPLLVERAIARSEVEVDGYADWKAAETRLPQPPTAWRWVTDRVVRWAAAWARERPGIVWVETVAVGRAVARIAGVPWYGAGPEAARGILEERGDRSIVASVRAHGTGRNLQRFSRVLVLAGIPTGAVYEQMMGRCHRAGQRAPAVEVEVPVCFSGELEAAQRDAEYIQATLGSAQKLLTAEWSHT